ncbi:hypothetical protein AYO40_05620 [Planctomycetaceae bacterium SCGC AG-212-D15]|nr:hypothetical protein AYO40_05620 [Planctomycetaceae bacterium SCGC AG-212-D15]
MSSESHCRENRRVAAAAAVAALWLASLAIPCLRAGLRPGEHSVYPCYVAAGRAWLAGADCYSGTGYRYSPLVAVAFTPFALLPDAIGDPLWHLLNAGVYLAGLAVWCRRVGQTFVSAGTDLDRIRHPIPPQITALFFLLVLPLSLGSLNNGQANALVLGLLLLALDAALRERWTFTAGAIALAGAFKVYPLMLGIVLANAFPRRIAGRLLLMIIALLILPLLCQDPHYVLEQYGSWVGHLQHDDRQVLPLPLAYRDLRLLLRMWVTPISLSTYFVIQMGTAVAIMVWCRYWIVGRFSKPARPIPAGLENRPTDPAPAPLLLALTTIWMTALGPSTEACTYILLAPSFAEYLIRAWRDRWPGWQQALLLGCYFLVTYPQIPLRLPGAALLSHHAAQCIGAFLFGAHVLASSRSPRQFRNATEGVPYKTGFAVPGNHTIQCPSAPASAAAIRAAS